MRKAWIVVVLVAIIISALSLSTARAKQIWDEQQAQSALRGARTDWQRVFTDAVGQGLSVSATAQFENRGRRLDQAKAPSASLLWSSSRADFFQRQARAYDQLRGEVLKTLHRQTVHARTKLIGQLGRLRSLLARAESLDVGAASQDAVLAQVTSSLPSMRTIKSLWRARRQILTADAGLRATVDARQTYVDGVVAQTHSNTAQISQLAARQVDGEQDRLFLLGLLSPRAASFRQSLASDLSAVNSAPTPFAAAVKDWSVAQDVAALEEDYTRTVPEKVIVVSTENQSATMYDGAKIVYQTPVTTGGPELPTDHGVFHIYAKISPFTFHSPWPPGSPYYYPPTPITYWMPFDGAEGLHDAWWRSNFGPGSNLQPTNLGTGNYILGTHGCVNLPMDAATFVWNWAPVGTTVVVI